MKFQIADAFSNQLFGGNPAGIVLLPSGSDFPGEEMMRRTAAELRYSETVFIRQVKQKVFEARYFTPASEVDLCGHATIASVHSLMEWKLLQENDLCYYQTKAGRLEISLQDGKVLMEMASPKNYGRISDPMKLKELYEVMGLNPEKQGQTACAEPLLPELVSTGLIDIMMPVRDLEQLNRIKPDYKRLTDLSKDYGVVGVHAFTLAGSDDKIHVRNFAPLYDIDEEAATGTSNGALTYYLYQHDLLCPGKIHVMVQGEKMGRPSEILSLLEIDNDEIRIRIGGNAKTLADGQIFL